MCSPLAWWHQNFWPKHSKTAWSVASKPLYSVKGSDSQELQHELINIQNTTWFLQEPLHKWHDHVDPTYKTGRLKFQRTKSLQCLIFIVFLKLLSKISAFLKAGAVMLFLKTSAGPEFHAVSYSKMSMQP